MAFFGVSKAHVSFDGNPRLTVITVYSPTEAATVDEAEDFHDVLRSAVKDVPAHHLLLVSGDLNAHLCQLNEEDSGWYWHQVSNRNGGLLRDTMLEGNLEATNHRFQKPCSKMWTHLSDGTLSKSQIDYILVRKKWRNSVKSHVARHDDILAHHVLFWDPQHGRRGPGRPHLTFLDMLKRDTKLHCSQEIQSVMLERQVWRGYIAARTKEPT